MKTLDLLFPPRATESLLERTTLAQFETMAKPRSIYSVEAILPYSDRRVKALIWELKYKDSKRAAEIGGSLLSSHLLETLANELVHTALLIPIPLYKERHRVRGYNQSERLAKVITNHIPSLVLAPHVLLRIRNTPRQTTLTRAKRLHNMKGAFVASYDVTGKVCVLIDDVVTTGSTLSEAASVLLESGASKVICLSLTYA